MIDYENSYDTNNHCCDVCGSKRTYMLNPSMRGNSSRCRGVLLCEKRETSCEQQRR